METYRYKTSEETIITKGDVSKMNKCYNHVLSFFWSMINIFFIVMYSGIMCLYIAKLPSLLNDSAHGWFIFIIVLSAWILLHVIVLKKRDYITTMISNKESNKGNQIIIAVICLLAILGYAFLVFSRLDSDAGVVNFLAYHYVAGDLSERWYAEYISYYNNNAPILCVLVMIYKIFLPPNMDVACFEICVLALLFSALAAYFLYKIIKSLFGQAMALLSLLLIFPLIIMSEEATILYSDIVALWTVPASLYLILLAVKEYNKKRIYIYIYGGRHNSGIWCLDKATDNYLFYCFFDNNAISVS